MKNVHKILRERLHHKAGLPLHDYEELVNSEWSPVFEGLMRRRLIMGALRYGRLREEGKKKYDRIASIIQRLGLYQQDGNLEHLVDAANLCLCEFEEGKTDSKKCFNSLDDHNHHTK